MSDFIYCAACDEITNIDEFLELNDIEDEGFRVYTHDYLMKNSFNVLDYKGKKQLINSCVCMSCLDQIAEDYEHETGKSIDY